MQPTAICPPPPTRWPNGSCRDYPLRAGGQGYVGHPALADPAFAKATSDVLVVEAMRLGDDLLDSRVGSGQHRSLLPLLVFRTDFWPLGAAAGFALAARAWLGPRSRR